MDLGAGALNARLHARHRQARLPARPVWESWPRSVSVSASRYGSRGRLTSGSRHRASSCRPRASSGTAPVVAADVDLRGELVGRGRDLLRARVRAVVVDDRVSRDAIGEPVEPVLEAQLAEGCDAGATAPPGRHRRQRRSRRSAGRRSRACARKAWRTARSAAQRESLVASAAPPVRLAVAAVGLLRRIAAAVLQRRSAAGAARLVLRSRRAGVCLVAHRWPLSSGGSLG